MNPADGHAQWPSERVSPALRIQVFGADATGQEFSEETEALLVSRYGAKTRLGSQLAPEQEVTIRCLATGLEAPARVVGKVGSSPEGYLYGIEIPDRETNIWGIKFPAAADSAQVGGRVLLECMACGARELPDLNDLELEVFQHSRRLSRKCRTCMQTTLWGECQHETPGRYSHPPPEPAVTVAASEPPRSGQREERRRAPRLKVRTAVCVRSYGRPEEQVFTEDVSRGGFCFRSRRRYPAGSSVEVAVPYTPGGMNIFVPARIAWAEKQPATGRWTYGVAYIQGRKDSPKR